MTDLVSNSDVLWVVELWIDPDWYEVQEVSEPLPSPGLPEIIPILSQVNLIGRASPSRGIAPEIELQLDTGVSRRHAQLTTDGTRWWVEDLGSANGTFIGSAANPLPAMPIPEGKVEIHPGQYIYLGAWSKILIRPAASEEAEAFSALLPGSDHQGIHTSENETGENSGS
ncbi:MAG: FHA domain-containing protein [Propionibacteriaceae bacterium]|jgi:hypothetical protein|nr:FHA domain-containing protein [Propionibacteriaceae bacterium]